MQQRRCGGPVRSLNLLQVCRLRHAAAWACEAVHSDATVRQLDVMEDGGDYTHAVSLRRREMKESAIARRRAAEPDCPLGQA